MRAPTTYRARVSFVGMAATALDGEGYGLTETVVILDVEARSPTAAAARAGARVCRDHRLQPEAIMACEVEGAPRFTDATAPEGTGWARGLPE